MLLTENEFKKICEKLLALTKATDAEVSVGSNDYSHLRFAANGFTTSGRTESASAQITVWIDGKSGSASASNVDEDSLKMAVQQAELLARISPVDKEYVPTLGLQRYKPTAGYVQATADISPTDRARRIDEIIRACKKAGSDRSRFSPGQR
jgi:predicted Zn-dependent protease